jgi:2-polyprenyl-3-methyl-5-hydroxy-6-metoxy-1,4-benzoquinol methylase
VTAENRQAVEAERVARAQFTAHADSFANSPIINDSAALDAIADLAEVSDADRVLDVACGPGIVSCHLAERGATVVGMDLTPATLELASRRADKLGLSSRTEFVPGSMDRLPFGDGEFSVVVSRYALHHAPRTITRTGRGRDGSRSATRWSRGDGRLRGSR